MNWQLKGTIFRYDTQYPTQNKQVAFTNSVESELTIILLGGLGDTLLSSPFVPSLVEFCTQNKINFVYPQLRSMPNYRIHTIKNDVEDLKKVIEKIEKGNIVLLGHSTGCQVAMLYIDTHGTDRIHSVVLQAPVSDVEFQESLNPDLKEKLEEARKCKYIEYNDQIWLSQRFLSVFDRNGQQDLFSTHLPDSHFQNWKIKFKIKIISIVSGGDRFVVKPNAGKLELGSEVHVIKDASHSLWEEQSREEFYRILKELFI